MTRASTLLIEHPLYRLALIPPTLLCPFSPPKPAIIASWRNFSSSFSFGNLQVTFITDRESFFACGFQKLLLSNSSYSKFDLAIFLATDASKPPFSSTQLRTLSRTKIPNVFGVLNKEPLDE